MKQLLIKKVILLLMLSSWVGEVLGDYESTYQAKAHKSFIIENAVIDVGAVSYTHLTLPTKA